MCLENVKRESKLTPRFWTVSVVVISGFKGRQRERKIGDLRHLLRKANEHKCSFRWVER